MKWFIAILCLFYFSQHAHAQDMYLKKAKAYYYGTSKVDQNYIKAGEYFIKSIEESDSIVSYRYLATMFLFGHGVEVDKAEAKKWLEMAVERGDERSQEIYDNYFSSEDKPTSTKKRIEGKLSTDTGGYIYNHTQDCYAGDAKSCAIIALKYYEGDMVDQSYPIAASFFSRACNGGFREGCYNLAVMYYEGTGIEKDEAKATELFDVVCRAGGTDGCNALNVLVNKSNENRTSSKTLPSQEPNTEDLTNNDLKKMCNDGYMEACYKRASNYRFGEHKNDEKMLYFYEKACYGNHADGCQTLGRLYYFGHVVKEDKDKGDILLKQAIKLFKKECNRGKMSACFALGEMYDAGLGEEKNILKIIKLWTKGCDGGDANSCFYLAMLHYEGKDIQENKSKAKELWRKACVYGEKQGCENVKKLTKDGI